MWVFGYGSLVWKAGFPFEEKVIGHIKGFQRRFWQGSVDHRGVPGKPGRVVTVVPSANPEDQVWGVAYRIAEQEVGNVFDYLNFREKNGYVLHTVTFHPVNPELSTRDVPLYISSEDNPYFLGPADLDEMAWQIYTSKGPSGPNLEYLVNLVRFMKEKLPQVKDNHLIELETAVHRLHMINSTSHG